MTLKKEHTEGWRFKWSTHHARIHSQIISAALISELHISYIICAACLIIQYVIQSRNNDNPFDGWSRRRSTLRIGIQWRWCSKRMMQHVLSSFPWVSNNSINMYLDISLDIHVLCHWLYSHVFSCILSIERLHVPFFANLYPIGNCHSHVHVNYIVQMNIDM